MKEGEWTQLSRDRFSQYSMAKIIHKIGSRGFSFRLDARVVLGKNHVKCNLIGSLHCLHDNVHR